MRAVRCDACGTKALTAASKCPTCGHLFQVRDGFGELLPLAYCSSCDSYYPESHGSCKWCGTKPERAPIGPYVWKGVGAAALVALAAGAWLMRDTRPEDAADKRMTAVLKQASKSMPADTVLARAVVAPVDTAVPRMTVASVDTSDRNAAQPPDTATVAVVPMSAPTSVAAPSAAPPSAAPPTVASRPDARSVTPPKALAKAAVSVAASALSKSRQSSRWVNSIARNWVVVRADASKGARIVASIGPDSRVQLGESRGSWRRIKARGIAGWVEPRSFFVAVRTPTTASGLAAR